MDTELDKVYGYFLKMGNSSFPPTVKRNSTVIKYTKLPDYEFNTKASWPQDSYTMQPRLRRIVGVDDHNKVSSRSLQNDPAFPSKVATTGMTRRKIISISEDDESNLHPKFSKDSKRSSSVKSSNRAVDTNLIQDKQQKSNYNFTNVTKSSKDSKVNVKMNNLYLRNNSNISKLSNKTNVPNTENDYRNMKEKELSWDNKDKNLPSKTSTLSGSNIMENNINIIKYKPNNQNMKSNTITKKLSEKTRIHRSSAQNKSKDIFVKDSHVNNKHISIIHVPLDTKYLKQNVDDTAKIAKNSMSQYKTKFDRGTDMNKTENLKDECIGTDYLIESMDQMAEVDNFQLNDICKSVKDTDVQTEVPQETFDSLDIPNVSLTKDKSETKKEYDQLQCRSLPNLRISSFTLNKEKNNSDIIGSCKNTSYIIRRATLTYTTKQEINFQVVDSNSDTGSNHCPSPLTYPLNVVSVYKKEIKNSDTNLTEIEDTYTEQYKAEFRNKNGLEELKSYNCSYVLNSNKLMKPSDIINTIRTNNSLLQSDCLCEQFQRELNFIDSFCESLRYLESASLSSECFSDNKIESLLGNTTLFEFDDRNSDYSSLLSKLENGTNIDDTETIASKSLCLLNLLIRDEQRRAKNLLFVLKMREDALKDFTKSQILWLENKKKNDNNNTPISTLKKKQRGALLKLQHECGEMQRMRKALLTLSEKRKTALMKTKKNIELKLKSNINVEQIIMEKKKIKRGPDNISDRNAAPLKCFDLSSSGCEDYTTSMHNSDACKTTPEDSIHLSKNLVKSAEKCIQTGDSIIGSLISDSSNIAENFVTVDGGYLNIIFRNLSLPEIFSSSKQYEVNEEALGNIVNSSNSSPSFNDSELVEKLMEKIKNNDLDRSSSPSTAHSLVDEFEQYYKAFADDENSSVLANLDYRQSFVHVDKSTPEEYGNDEGNGSVVYKEFSDTVSLDPCECKVAVESNYPTDGTTSEIPTGPLPVPAGEAAITDPKPLDVPIWISPKLPTSNSPESCSFSSNLCGSVASSMSLPSIVNSEAEELRRQQLAIEREIKALEQQLVVREIPDKPPPPYTPPSDTRIPKPPRMFNGEETTEKIKNIITNPANPGIDPTDSFDIFLQEFSNECVEKQKSEQSEKPWDACNLLPQKKSLDTNQLVKKTSSQLLEVLNGAPPTVVSSVGTRRSDHIDDILFSEWRRCEPEWTNLHTDEAVVKNQVFDSIFQKLLSETVDEYKRIVHDSNND